MQLSIIKNQQLAPALVLLKELVNQSIYEIFGLFAALRPCVLHIPGGTSRALSSFTVRSTTIRPTAAATAGGRHAALLKGHAVLVGRRH